MSQLFFAVSARGENKSLVRQGRVEFDFHGRIADDVHLLFERLVELAVPGFDRELAIRHAPNDEFATCVGDSEPWRVQHDDPAKHPWMHVASELDDIDIVEFA